MTSFDVILYIITSDDNNFILDEIGVDLSKNINLLSKCDDVYGFSHLIDEPSHITNSAGMEKCS